MHAVLGLNGQLPAPVHDQQEAEEHAAEVGKVRHARLRARYSKEEFEHPVAEDKPLGFHRYRGENQHDDLIRKDHAEGQQNPKDSA